MDWSYFAAALISVGAVIALFGKKSAKLATGVGALTLGAGAVAAFAGTLMQMAAGISGNIAWIFQLPIEILALAAAFHSPGYIAGHGSSRSNVYWFFLNLTVAAMLMVTLSSTPISFLLAWEVMGMASFALVVFDRESAVSRKAGWIYLAACHAGAALLMLYFLYPDCGGVSAFFLLAGFGLKIGFPLLHVWLPEAHPAAPAPVSALMSGAMIELGFFGIFQFASLGNFSGAVLGWSLLTLGIVGAFGGIIFALAQHNLKKLLAYSSIENMGLISIASGLWILGIFYNKPAIAGAACAGTILHILNHALLKGGLFLCAGSVLKSCGTLNMDKMGGLMHRAPATGTAFTLHALSLCGLPPFNGFVSEFLIYLSAFAAVTSGNGILIAAGTVVLVIVALTGGLAAAALAKAVGAAFLGEPRSESAKNAGEVPLMMTLAQFALLILAVMLVCLTPELLSFIASVCSGFPEIQSETASLKGILSKISVVSVVFTAFMALVLLLCRIKGRGSTRQSCTWDCGYVHPDPRMEYTATAFTQPLSDLFSPVLKTEKKLTPVKSYFPDRASFEEKVSDGGIKRFWEPLFSAFTVMAEKIHRLQSGFLHFYILVIVTALILMLAVAILGFN